MADRHGGKVVMAYGVTAFSAMSLLMPLLLRQVCASGLLSREVELGRSAKGCSKTLTPITGDAVSEILR